MDKKKIDWVAFGKEVMGYAELHGGLANLAELLDIPYQRLWRIRMGQEPKAGDYCDLMKQIRGKVVQP